MACIVLLFLGAGWVARDYLADARRGIELPKEPRRIISLAPSITETLYALGAGDRVAGVTRFCQWPSEAAKKPKVGGFREINLEAIARLKPDLVILPEDMEHFRPGLEALRIPVATLDSRSLKGYIRDVEKLGAICGEKDRAKGLVEEFGKNMRAGKKDAEKPSILFLLMNAEECGLPVTELSAIGRDGFYDELIKAAGGRNAYQGGAPYPRISREAILAINPDLIIVAAPACKEDDMKKSWSGLGGIKAVEKGRICFLNDPGDTVPGPRSLQTLRRLESSLRSVKVEGK